MAAVAAEPDNEELWKPVEAWVLQKKNEYDDRIAAESWFVTDDRGVQIARSPISESIGQQYHHRDYFHGKGAMFVPEKGAEVLPISEQHLSAVYASTSTGALKVAFSVPITDGAKQNPRVLGVLAMSVDLGDFDVLEKRLQRPLEVVLVDLRQDNVEDTGHRGLLLHHRDLSRYQSAEHPLRVPPELLSRIEFIRQSNRATGEPSSSIVEKYSDLLDRNGSLYWGAVEPVVISDRSGSRDTEWVVIVQEQVKK